MTTTVIKPAKPVKPANFVKRIIERHEHKIVWIGMPLLCCAIWGMIVTGAIALCH